MTHRILVPSVGGAGLVSIALAWTIACHDSASRATEDRRSVDVESDCFEGEKLRRSWTMDETKVQWNAMTARFEEGVFVNGARQGCWTVWYEDGTFDSGSSGSYIDGVKVESAPSPLGDFDAGVRGGRPRER